jgi:ferritin
MKTNRLSNSLTQALNEQMIKEAHASQTYLSFASWAENEGFGGISNFLFRHAAEELKHMMKILEYILKRGAKAKVIVISAPTSDPTSVNNCFERVFEHKVKNTKAVYKIVKLSFDEEDWATWNFMQRFVKEQKEEETLAINLLDKIKNSGGEKATHIALYKLDKDLEKTPNKVRLN